MEEINDDVLLQGLRMGNNEAFSRIYTKYWRKIYMQAYDRLKDIKQSQDITQDVFISLWERREQLEIQHLYAYLSTAVKYKVFKLVAKLEVRDDFYSLAEKQLPLSSAADHPLLTRELIASFRHFVENMPPQRKKIFQLRFEENLNTKAIAHQLNITQKTVQNQLLNSYRDIRALLAQLLSACVLVMTCFRM